MTETNKTPIMSLAFKAGYDDGILCGTNDVAAKYDYFDTPGDADDGDYCQGFKLGYADGYSGVTPLNLELEIVEDKDGNMEYFLTYENKRQKVS